jgi:tetratricopeptide (TPR) repeat protein
MSPLAAAERALLEGRFDDVDTETARLDAADPDAAALKAQAAIARGRYQQAEDLLRPMATRAPSSEAALQLGLLLQRLKHSEATAVLERVAPLGDTSNDPVEIARGARAMRALGRVRAANAAFQVASASAPRDTAINTAWGELFLQTHQDDEALKSFQDVLAADPRWTPALIGAARAFAEDDPPQAVAFAERALAVNPSLVEAYVFLAARAADADRRPQALEALQKALTINPSSLEARALVAAIAYVEDRQADFDAEVAKTLQIAPAYGEVYRVAGELAAHNYRFDEAVGLTRRGLALDPQDARALADLGMHLLRTGDEPAARAALEASFKIENLQWALLNSIEFILNH